MRINRTFGGALFVAASLSLAACGGDDDSSPAPQQPPATPSISIGGTAVKGVALSGAAVTVKCATGSGTATATATGTYTVTVNGTLPCVLKAVGTDGTTYHSVVAGTGNSGTYTANISPLTEMVVAHIANAQPAAFFAAFGSTSTVTAQSVAAADLYVQTAMAGLTDLSGVHSVTDPLAVGNALDQKIDAVTAGLASAGLSVPAVTNAIVANPAAPSVVAAPLAPSAASCPWLKSGKYRILDRGSTDYRFAVVTVDAAALTVRLADNTVPTLTSDGACQFSLVDLDGTFRILVSSGGMLMVHLEPSKAPFVRELSIGFPEQTLPVSELQGTWNVANWDMASLGAMGQAVALNSEAMIDATGQVTAASACLGLAPCVPEPAPLPRFVANSAGGFDLMVGTSALGRLFAYKTVAGDKVMVLVDDANGISVFAPKQPLALPAVGFVNRYRTLRISGNDVIDALEEDEIRIMAADSTAGTATRIRTSDGRVDTPTYNKPRDGLRHRSLNSCNIGGAPAACSEVVTLPLPGMGVALTVSATVQPTPSFFEFSVNKP